MTVSSTNNRATVRPTTTDSTTGESKSDAATPGSSTSTSAATVTATAETQHDARTVARGVEAMLAQQLASLLQGAQAKSATPEIPIDEQKAPDAFADVDYMKPPFVDGATATLGGRDPAVSEAQEHLKELGYDVPQTGIFDAKTKAAVAAFQAEKGLKPGAGREGVLGATTLNFLRSASNTPSLDEVMNGAEMKLGASGPAVLEMQKMLGFGPAGQTGVLGPTTLRALADFQKSKGLTDNVGTFDASTLEALKADFQTRQTSSAVGSFGPAIPFDGDISDQGRQQMQEMLEHARNNSAGRRPDGRCYFHVANYIDRLGYGGLSNIGTDLPGDKLGEARHFAEHMNQPGNAAKAGLQRIDNGMSPPITNPYDPRIPPGAIVVVPPGVPGTRHPTAGDIAIADGTGRFFNGGEMGYGGAAGYPDGKLLGIYIPQ